MKNYYNKFIRTVSIAILLFLVFGITACSSLTNASQETTSQSETTKLQSQTDQDRIAELEDENITLKIQVNRLQSQLDAISNQYDNHSVAYMIEVILELMADPDIVVEIFSADIQEVKLAGNQFVFDIARHRPGWGWEVTMGEEDEGYPIEDVVIADSSLIYMFNTYNENMDDLVKAITENPSQNRLNFLMINDRVVWISEETGP